MRYSVLRDVPVNTHDSDSKSVWGSRLYGGDTPRPNRPKSAAMSTPTTISRPVASRINNNNITPKTAARVVSSSLSSHYISSTPQKALFQRALLRSIDHAENKPLLTVVLDLDETLVSNRRADLPRAILRPYVLHVLNAMRQMNNVEIILWTASTRETGAPVVEQLQNKGLIFDEVIFRNDIWFTEPVHTKDIRLLGRDLDRVIVFDNAPNCCKLNKENCVLIDDFNGNTELSDGSLVNLYYIVDAVMSNCCKGVGVRTTLEQLEKERQLLRSVCYSLPDAWANHNLRDVAPLMIPPHGKYLRMFFESAAPLDPWTR